MSNLARKEKPATDAAPAAFPWRASYAPGVEWHIDIPNEPLYALLDQAAARFPDRTALVSGIHRYDYKTFICLVNHAAAGLAALGLKKGGKIGLMMPNSAYSFVMYFAALKTGGTVVNFNPAYIERDLLKQAQDSEIDMLVTLDTPALQEKAASLLALPHLVKIVLCPLHQDLTAPTALESTLPAARTVWFADLVKNSGTFDAPRIDAENDVAVLQYTGGTTGIPKGAMLTHKNLIANARQMARWYHTAEDGQDSIVAVLPLFHVFAMTVAMNMAIARGMTIFIMPQFNAGEILDLVKRERPTFMAAVPTMYIALANDSRIADCDFSSLKFCLSGGAPLPLDVKRAFEQRSRARLVAEGYGLTEFSPVMTCSPLLSSARAGSIGLPIPGTIVEIVSLEDGKTVLKPNQTGEICAKGPQMMKGYYKRDDETAEVIREGRLHSGDVGYMDEDGFVYIVDRVKDLVLVGGFNVYPRHVEEVIYTHPAVEECIVAGVPDKLRGEAVQAWVKLRAGESVSTETLRAYLSERLSAIEIPKRLIIRDEPLPKTSVGKLSKRLLLEQEGLLK